MNDKEGHGDTINKQKQVLTYVSMYLSTIFGDLSKAASFVLAQCYIS